MFDRGSRKEEGFRIGVMLGIKSGSFDCQAIAFIFRLFAVVENVYKGGKNK